MMRFSIILVLAVLMAFPVFAAGPIPGTYKSTDLGGAMLTGIFSESWTTPNGHLAPGNTNNMESFDGVSAGTQWTMSCAGIAGSPILLLDTVDINGNGTQRWFAVYSGGSTVLDGAGPWGDGSEPSYTGMFTSYDETKTLLFSNFQLVGVNSTISLNAEVLGFTETCISLTLANSSQLGTTDSAALPAGFPGFLDPLTCLPTRTMGSWGEVDQFTLVITGCVTPVEESTWGMIKQLYE